MKRFLMNLFGIEAKRTRAGNKAAPSRRSRGRFVPGVEALDDRILLTTNVAINGISFVDGHGNKMDVPTVGTLATARVGWHAQGMPTGAQFEIQFTYADGSTISDPISSLWSSDYSGVTDLSDWLIRPGSQTLTAQVLPIAPLVQTTLANNTKSVPFIPATFQSEFNGETQFVTPIAGVPFVNWTISNYVDLDPGPGKMDYTGATGDNAKTYDGHNGMDLVVAGFPAMDAGVPIFAAASGIVSTAEDGHFDRNTTKCNDDGCTRDGGYDGNFVVIDHGNGWTTTYAHMREGSVAVKKGDVVKAGDLIGLVGSSGNSTGPHLHFQVEHLGQLVEPYMAPDSYWVSPVPYSGGQDFQNQVGSFDLTPPTHPFNYNWDTKDLAVNPDASGVNDTVTLDIVGSNLQVDINGDVTLFPLSWLNSVTVNENGNGTQLIYKGPSVASLNYTLTGPDSGSMQLAPLAVSYSGVDTVTLSSPADTMGKLVLQGGCCGLFTQEKDTVTGAGAGSIQLDSTGWVTINYAHVTELDDLVQVPSATYDIAGGSGGTAPWVSVADGPTVNGIQTTALWPTYRHLIYGGPKGHGGPVGYTTVSDPPVNFANKAGVTVQGGGPNAAIDVNNPNPAAGLATLAIDGQGSPSVTVESTPKVVATSVSNSGTVTLNAPGQGVQAILGKVTVSNSSLIVDDTGDMTPHPSIQFDDDPQSDLLSGLAPAQINWSGLSSLTITGGGGGNSYTVGSWGNIPSTTLNAGQGANTIHLDVSPQGTYSFHVNGGPANDELDLYVAAPAPTINQSAGEVDVHVWNQGTVSVGYSDIEKLVITQAPPSGKTPKSDQNHPLPPPWQLQQNGDDPVPPAHQPKPIHKGKKQGGHSQRARHRGRRSHAARRHGVGGIKADSARRSPTLPLPPPREAMA